MKYTLLIASIFLLCNCRTYKASAQNNPTDTLIRIITCGRPNFSTIAEESKLAAKWGFYFDNALGCMVSKNEIDSLNAYNKIAERPLTEIIYL